MRKKTNSKVKIDKTNWQKYDYHLPVLLQESVDFLIKDKFVNDTNALYIDGTLGGGGHAAHIMQKIRRGTIFAFDKDISAIERAIITFEEELKKPSPSIVLFNKSFSEACGICESRGRKPNGILLDLGVSSKQLDSDQRGISYRVNSPLDMRFDSGGNLEGANNFLDGTNSSNLNLVNASKVNENLYKVNNNLNETKNKPTAKDILNTKTEDELTAIFRNYGEEPKSRAIARRIVEIRRVQPLETTYDLRAIIEDCIPKIHHFKTLSRIFQAIRIEVNRELDELAKTLQDIINILDFEGRIVVISYHSLEDRIVKQIFKSNSATVKTNKYAANKIDKELNNENNNLDNYDISLSNTVPKNLFPRLKLITVKPITPSFEEICRNPRARSAKMRVAEKI